MIWERGSLIDRDEYGLSYLEFVCEDMPAGYFPDFAVSDSDCPVVSKRFRDFFDQQQVKNAEYFPVRVIEKKGNTLESGFIAVNMVGLVNCIDLKVSDIDADREGGEIISIDFINKLRLREDSFGVLDREDLFRRLIVVEEPLFSGLRSQKYKGIKLIEPGRWDGFYGER